MFNNFKFFIKEFGPTGPSDLRVATLSDIEPLPVIIKEVLYP